jgi:hypothetical protein
VGEKVTLMVTLVSGEFVKDYSTALLISSTALLAIAPVMIGIGIASVKETNNRLWLFTIYLFALSTLLVSFVVGIFCITNITAWFISYVEGTSSEILINRADLYFGIQLLLFTIGSAIYLIFRLMEASMSNVRHISKQSKIIGLLIFAACVLIGAIIGIFIGNDMDDIALLFFAGFIIGIMASTIVFRLSGNNKQRELCVPLAQSYIGNRNTDVYHSSSCRYAQRIDPSNIISFNSTEQNIRESFKPCRVCNP